jgi:hypothetical protein
MMTMIMMMLKQIKEVVVAVTDVIQVEEGKTHQEKVMDNQAFLVILFLNHERNTMMLTTMTYLSSCSVSGSRAEDCLHGVHLMSKKRMTDCALDQTVHQQITRIPITSHHHHLLLHHHHHHHHCHRRRHRHRHLCMVQVMDMVHQAAMIAMMWSV